MRHCLGRVKQCALDLSIPKKVFFGQTSNEGGISGDDEGYTLGLTIDHWEVVYANEYFQFR